MFGVMDFFVKFILIFSVGDDEVAGDVYFKTIILLIFFMVKGYWVL